ncbi:MAG: GNAT family N-acetyltransferase [Bacteroidales bacterium]|nr:MAG: GNAT family N-acetyltransferase [Bacteroidales bacterium]
MIVIKDIKTSELEEFINSDEFKKLEHIPISRLRAISNIHNPRGNKDDKLLFLAYDDDMFIGYLGAISDNLNIDNKTHKVAWLSCMWIDNNYRRQGIALKLLNHAYDIWETNLLITNYIPSSRKTFEKTGKYTELKSLPGVRGYLRFNLAEIMILKRPGLGCIKWLLLLFDLIANVIIGIRLVFWRMAMNITRIKIEYLNELDSETDEFIRQRSKDNLSPKDKSFFDWIKKYPWVLNTPFEDYTSRRYEFSAVDKNFDQLYIKVMNNENKMLAFLMLTVHGTHLKTPYLFFDKEYNREVRKVIYAHLLKLKVRTFTSFHPQMVEIIWSKRNPFILTRKMYHRSLITKELLAKIKNLDKYILMEGDGDCAFV